MGRPRRVWREAAGESRDRRPRSGQPANSNDVRLYGSGLYIHIESLSKGIPRVHARHLHDVRTGSQIRRRTMMVVGRGEVPKHRQVSGMPTGNIEAMA
jgi:hypothetical protein